MGEEPHRREAVTVVRVLVYAEGQTEEVFVKQVIVPHLSPRGIYVIPTLAKTRRTKYGPHFKGGITSYERTRRDILGLLGDSNATLVTTMIDFYGLPREFPGVASIPSGSCYARVAYLEEAFSKEIGHPRFKPYFQLHEFEALVFVRPSEVARVFGLPEKQPELESIRALFGSPEEIDDGETTAPSKRLRALFPAYQKPLHSPLIARRTGLEALRKECRHFDGWLNLLERLGA